MSDRQRPPPDRNADLVLNGWRPIDVQLKRRHDLIP
jgi:hypothetical protein